MGHSCSECKGFLGGPCDDRIVGYAIDAESDRFWQYFKEHNADEPKCPLCGEGAVMDWISEFIDDSPGVWAKCQCISENRKDTIYDADGLPQIKIWRPYVRVLKWSWLNDEWENVLRVAKKG